MVNSIYTIHAEKQLQRRSTGKPVECLIAYGREYACTRGTVRYHFDRESFRDACNDGFYSRQALEKARNLYVIASDGVIITVAQRTKKHLRNI